MVLGLMQKGSMPLGMSNVERDYLFQEQLRACAGLDARGSNTFSSYTSALG